MINETAMEEYLVRRTYVDIVEIQYQINGVHYFSIFEKIAILDDKYLKERFEKIYPYRKFVAATRIFPEDTDVAFFNNYKKKNA